MQMTLFFSFHPSNFDSSINHQQNAFRQIFSWITASLDHHVSRICAGCYYRLRQLRRLRRSLDSNSWLHSSTPLWIHRLIIATLFFWCINWTVTDKLQRVLNATARVVTGTWKFEYRKKRPPKNEKKTGKTSTISRKNRPLYELREKRFAI